MLLDSAGQDESDCLPKRNRRTAKTKPTNYQGLLEIEGLRFRCTMAMEPLFNGDGTIVPSPSNHHKTTME